MARKPKRKNKPVPPWKKEGFQSGFEKTVWDNLVKKRGKFTKEYETRKITYVVPEQQRTYTPDIVLESKDKIKVIYVETKGYLRPSDRTLLRRVKHSNPDLDIRMLFQKDNKIKNTKMRYSDWALRNGFPYHVGSSVPDEWVREVL